MGTLELVLSLCCKVACSNSKSLMLVMVDCEGMMTVKKSYKCGEYGMFEHLLFLFILCFVDTRVGLTLMPVDVCNILNLVSEEYHGF